MRGRLFKCFCLREKGFFILFLSLFLLGFVHTMYLILTVMSNYYCWNPVKELEGDWYYYTDWSLELDELESYVRQEQGGMMLEDFRIAHCTNVDTDKLYFDDIYADGFLFEATEEELGEMRENFSEAVDIRPVSEVLAEKYGYRNAVGLYRTWIQVLFLVLIVGSGALWFRRALKKGREERRYLSYVGFSSAAMWRRYCSYYFWVTPVLWLFSFGAVVLPEPAASSVIYFDNSPFWKIDLAVVLLMFALYAGVSGILLLVFRICWRRENATVLLAEKLTLVERRELCIEELSLCDNLKLIFMAQGYSERAADEVVRRTLREREVGYGGDDGLLYGGMNERLLFCKLRDELMGE